MKVKYLKSVLVVLLDLTLLSGLRLSLVAAAPIQMTESNPHQVTNYRVIVNSNQDGIVQPDENLTLREAIEIVNGTLLLNQLSEEEKYQVSSLDLDTPSQINFNLPATNTTIRLVTLLPPLASPGLVVDGTTQPGYDPMRFTKEEIPIHTPVVEITSAQEVEVLRGLTIVADGVTIRGLSLYGFTGKFNTTATIPPGDIFIDTNTSSERNREDRTPNKIPPTPHSPKNIVIEDNWIGVPSENPASAKTSGFGVSIFNSQGTAIRRNWIANHTGSGVITSVDAQDLQVEYNVISNNGNGGMPDAIRLEGNIDNTQISSNLIEDNGGSAVFLFKPEGAVTIQNNQIKNNGTRLRRAAIYLMGNDHQVIDNQISKHHGPGVVVAAFPSSNGNIIQNNRFSGLEGLSIDLITRDNTDTRDYQVGDGQNPPRNSNQRRQDTGNGAINTPQFLSPELIVLNGKVNIDGMADPGSQVDIYRVTAQTDLSEQIATVTTDEKGRFSLSLSNLQPGERISAIATDSKYGTSEAAASAVVRLLE
ncbi:right-handed parallel beta-helix repeat-containing protein [Limnofasciculus baicalensis]|uniref:Right-handed parallel beta-helix repeat-containing protein n=1 Tax=Limnofasciculus baicalensis BBK-W-15 TaxID=2699891 RepID=A0AAE3GT65_9CYAN|nr:right-handed parallel beta-helix repeat-containing protein [Limnofasciculus baicalensis]MCP2729333.1 right-handed parallel beta-helix repeat-containing protein [Limnofasciculus baicalensis BBK-W-15]